MRRRRHTLQRTAARGTVGPRHIRASAAAAVGSNRSRDAQPTRLGRTTNSRSAPHRSHLRSRARRAAPIYRRAALGATSGGSRSRPAPTTSRRRRPASASGTTPSTWRRATSWHWRRGLASRVARPRPPHRARTAAKVAATGHSPHARRASSTRPTAAADASHSTLPPGRGPMWPPSPRPMWSSSAPPWPAARSACGGGTFARLGSGATLVRHRPWRGAGLRRRPNILVISNDRKQCRN